jgi:hypothetical protein
MTDKLHLAVVTGTLNWYFCSRRVQEWNMCYVVLPEPKIVSLD